MIAAAAIKYRDVIVSMPRPNRHHNIIYSVYNLWSIRTGSNGVQGFITDTGEFVDRVEGLRIARDNNQIIHKHGSDKELFSEDMW
jgi:hypothetical protein